LCDDLEKQRKDCLKIWYCNDWRQTL
jgi:hypothetical protein